MYVKCVKKTQEDFGDMSRSLSRQTASKNSKNFFVTFVSQNSQLKAIIGANNGIYRGYREL